MKLILIVAITFLIFTVPVFSELTTEDLEKIRSIVKDEVTSSEKQVKGYKDNTHALILRFPLTEIELQGTKLECNEGYQALHDILNSKKTIKGSKFVVSPVG